MRTAHISVSGIVFRRDAMPKIIFTSRYLRDVPPAKLENYVRYIDTCGGVEKVEGNR